MPSFVLVLSLFSYEKSNRVPNVWEASRELHDSLLMIIFTACFKNMESFISKIKLVIPNTPLAMTLCLSFMYTGSIIEKSVRFISI